MTYWIDEVVDEHGGVLELGRQLGRGGQGEVRRVSNHPGLAVKLMYSAHKLRLDRVRRLPLSGLPIAAPTLLLEAHRPGYVMRLADDMIPLAELAPPQFGIGMDARWYRETGGLRRRLILGAKLSDALAKLHGRSIVYVDLNPNNVMVSSNIKRDEVWLIDADNLTVRSQARSDLGFHRYFAPERWTGPPDPTPESDAYSLAVVLYSLIAKWHPFEGTAALDVSGEEANNLINAGSLAFVDHPTDASNRAPDGTIDRRHTLSPALRVLARRAFVDGLRLPRRRPTASEWRDTLFDALGHVIACPSCRWTYYGHEPSCPACDRERQPLAGAAIHGSLDSERPTRTCVVQPRETRRLTHRLLWGVGSGDDHAVSLRIEDENVGISWTRGAQVEVLYPRRQRKAHGQTVHARMRRGQQLRLSVRTEHHPERIVDLGWIDE